MVGVRCRESRSRRLTAALSHLARDLVFLDHRTASFADVEGLKGYNCPGPLAIVFTEACAALDQLLQALGKPRRRSPIDEIVVEAQGQAQVLPLLDAFTDQGRFVG